jgi:hypothetical protein
MIPAFVFLLWSRNMHSLWTARTRDLVTAITTAATLLFCVQNTYLDLPMVDFRPFKIGNNIRERKDLESSAKIDILGWVLENSETGEKVKFMEPEAGKITYYKEYPKNKGWNVKDQIKTDWYVLKDSVKIPITKTKVSDFAIESAENGEITDDILGEKGYSLMIVAYKLEGSQQKEMVTVRDTVWAIDSIAVTKDSFQLERRLATVNLRQVERTVFVPTTAYADLFTKGVNPLADAATKAGWKVYAVTIYGDAENAVDFARKVGAKYPFHRADDKLLKTIVRANPGVVVWKDGQVLDMYHHRHLPTFDQLSVKFK